MVGDRNMKTRDYYEVLQVSPDAEPEVVQAAYRRLAQKYHPDVNALPEAGRRMQELNEAYEVLSDASKRAAYNSFLAQQERRETTRTTTRQGYARWDEWTRPHGEASRDWEAPPASPPQRTVWQVTRWYFGLNLAFIVKVPIFIWQVVGGIGSVVQLALVVLSLFVYDPGLIGCLAFLFFPVAIMAVLLPGYLFFASLGFIYDVWHDAGKGYLERIFYSGGAFAGSNIAYVVYVLLFYVVINTFYPGLFRGPL